MALGIRVALRISLVSPGGCHHLDGWSSGEGSARVGDCSWPPLVIVRGVTFLGGVPKGNSSKFLVSLSYLTCGSVLVVSYHVDEVCETPLSRRTTKCWSTQRGLACWHAREPREKIGCLLSFVFSR